MNKYGAFFIFLFVIVGILIGIQLFIIIPLDKYTPILNESNNKIELIDIGYNLETNERLWKYPNETIWRSDIPKLEIKPEPSFNQFTINITIK
jgi:hypothetical protein